MLGRFQSNVARQLFAASVGILVISIVGTSQAQFFRAGAVGGVKVDVNGVVSNPEVSELKDLQAAWEQGLKEVPADLEKWTDLRFVSLKQLEAETDRWTRVSGVVDRFLKPTEGAS